MGGWNGWMVLIDLSVLHIVWVLGCRYNITNINVEQSHMALLRCSTPWFGLSPTCLSWSCRRCAAIAIMSCHSSFSSCCIGSHVRLWTKGIKRTLHNILPRIPTSLFASSRRKHDLCVAWPWSTFGKISMMSEAYPCVETSGNQDILTWCCKREIDSQWNHESSVYYTWPKIFLPCTYLLKWNFSFHLETIIVSKNANRLDEISRTQDSRTPKTHPRFYTSSQIDPPSLVAAFGSRVYVHCLIRMAICPKPMNTVVVPCVRAFMISAPDPHKHPSEKHQRK
jgi:hypothetical protein